MSITNYLRKLTPSHFVGSEVVRGSFISLYSKPMELAGTGVVFIIADLISLVIADLIRNLDPKQVPRNFVRDRQDDKKPSLRT